MNLYQVNISESERRGIVVASAPEEAARKFLTHLGPQYAGHRVTNIQELYHDIIGAGAESAF